MGGFKLGRILGFPVEIRTSFLLLLLLVLLTAGGLAGVFFVLLAFASVLAHELGHAVVARRLGVRIAGIDLHFFGGTAKMATMPRSARDEALIAAAGPGVSFGLAGIAGLIYAASGVHVFGQLALINLVLGGFNLLPALPMDGGRIFRALLTRRWGYRRATEISVKVARVVAVGLFGISLVNGSLFMAALAVLLWIMASQELRLAQITGYGGVPPWASRTGGSSPLNLGGPAGSGFAHFVHFEPVVVRPWTPRRRAPPQQPSRRHAPHATSDRHASADDGEPVTVEVLDRDGRVVNRGPAARVAAE